jgi:hypothetical protein
MTKLRLHVIPSPQLVALQELQQSVVRRYGDGAPNEELGELLERALDLGQEWFFALAEYAETVARVPCPRDREPLTVKLRHFRFTMLSELRIHIDPEALPDWRGTPFLAKLVDKLEHAARHGYELRAYEGRWSANLFSIHGPIKEALPTPIIDATPVDPPPDVMEPTDPTASAPGSGDSLVDWFCKTAGVCYPHTRAALDRAYQRTAEYLTSQPDQAAAQILLTRLSQAYGRCHELLE